MAPAHPHATSVAMYPALFREELFHFLERNDSLLEEGKVSFRDAASDEAKGWTFLIDTKYVIKWRMSDGEQLTCICNRRTPLMLNDKKRKARDKYKLKRQT